MGGAAAGVKFYAAYPMSPSTGVLHWMAQNARDLGIMSMEDAVRSMTGLPAHEFGLKERGLVKPGYYADLVLFDPATVIDRADFQNPMQPAGGIDRVLVNGEPVWQAGAATGARPGRAIRLQETARGAG